MNQARLPNEKTPEEALGLTYGEFTTILSELSNKATSIAEATGTLRSAIKGHLDAKGWHKQALGLVRTVDDMSDTKRADFLRTFLPMLDMMMERKWRNAMADLIPDADSGGDED